MIDDKLTSFELFAGAGGLALASEFAGLESLGLIEWDKWACRTMRVNKAEGYGPVSSWDIHEMDVRDFNWGTLPEAVDVLAGGPPCQPFSLGGRHNANEDARDMFPAMTSVVRRLAPRAFVIENVKGLLRAQFSDYYQYVLLRLEFPERTIRYGESWTEHLARLQKAKTSSPQSSNELTYNVVPTLVNAADYGVPQCRERVFIVGFQSSLGIEWSFPKPTHSKEALMWAQRKGGEYWERHGLNPRCERHAASHPDEGHKPWRTVRDALVGLPNPRQEGDKAVLNHELRTGAKTYPGHTGSSLDLPSKTLKAGVHGVPGGENMLIGDDGEPRYYTVREAARIQTFPDGYKIEGSWSEAMRQLGNAVPVVLGQVVMKSVAAAVLENELVYRTRYTLKEESRICTM